LTERIIAIDRAAASASVPHSKAKMQ